MFTTIKLRRATASEWLAKNPILSAGEPGFETDTGKLKVGNGLAEWTTLDYFEPNDPSSPLDPGSLQEHVDSELPHPVYDDGPSFTLLYENAKV